MAIPFLSRITEARASRQTSLQPPTRSAAALHRQGWVTGIPIGGSTAENPALSNTSGALDRGTFMTSLLNSYLNCPASSACVDAIARTATAGGVEVVPNSQVDGDTAPTPPPGVKKVQALLAYVNPYDDIRQLMRAVVSDLEIFGDSFTEIVYLMDEPVALYPLDPCTMSILADEHGIVNGYKQTMDTGREAFFAPHEVIHVKFDSPGGGLYGTSPTQKAALPITTWLFTAALIKESMRKGDPLRLHIDWPLALPPSEMKRFQEQYGIRNIGARNIGNLVETKGGAVVQELATNQLQNWLLCCSQKRDEILTIYGVPPSKIAIIEAGNLGGGTGSAQDRTFRICTLGPVEEIVMEKWTFMLLYQAFGVTDWHMRFGDIDWRDDQVLEGIRDMRVRNGAWTINRLRSDIGEPPVEGGDTAIIVDRQNMTPWADLQQLSDVNIDAIKAKGVAASAATSAAPPNTPGAPGEALTLDEIQESLYLRQRYAEWVARQDGS